jgi:quercetin dioxygenase-like cupin family protein
MPALQVTTVAAGAANGGAYMVLDVRARAGAALPPHLTSREDVALLVIAGQLEAVLADGRRVAAEGQAVSLPRGAPRRLAALTDLRLLCLAAPAGLEQLADVLAGPLGDPDDRAALLTAAGISLLPAAWGARQPLG